jgi:hypothetical protein
MLPNAEFYGYNKLSVVKAIVKKIVTLRTTGKVEELRTDRDTNRSKQRLFQTSDWFDQLKEFLSGQSSPNPELEEPDLVDIHKAVDSLWNSLVLFEVQVNLVTRYFLVPFGTTDFTFNEDDTIRFFYLENEIRGLELAQNQLSDYYFVFTYKVAYNSFSSKTMRRLGL